MKSSFLRRTLAVLLMAAAVPAFADRGGHWSRPYRPYGVEHHHHDRHGPAPLAWGIAGLALGSVLYAISAPPPRPVVIAPAVTVPPPSPPGQYWYYCEPYRAYYPNVPDCPTQWRAVPAY